MDEWLSDRELGGFYASQDADDSLDDDGDYFTWTRDEAEEVLTAEEFAVAEKYFQPAWWGICTIIRRSMFAAQAGGRRRTMR